MKTGVPIYIASKTKHAEKWKKIRASGYNIISTWIDFVGKEENNQLEIFSRCVDECQKCYEMIVYAEKDDILRGAYIEMGIAFHNGSIDIYLVGDVLPFHSVFTSPRNIYLATSVEQAIFLINNKHKP